VVEQTEMDWATQVNPLVAQDSSGSDLYLDEVRADGEGQVAIFSGGPRFPALPGADAGGQSDSEGAVWGTVTLTKRLFAGQNVGKAEEVDGDDDELKYEEEGGERDDGGEPEGPDDEMDGVLYGDETQRDDEYAYDDDQRDDGIQQDDGEAADFPPWGEGGEFQFDPRVDDRYFQHSSDDEVWLDQPASDEVEPDGDEPLRL
jgi:hypothetical protein